MGKGPRPLYGAEDCARELVEPDDQALDHHRGPFRRDLSRVLHAPGFRRLQGKTQLFPGQDSDFFRNRLTHSLEVAQIATSIARRLNAEVEPFNDESGKYSINTDLVELAGLAHDLGHPPFGHNGEAALDECMKEFGGFEGNAQSLRILAKLEKRRTKVWPPLEISSDGTDQRLGLNLTYRSLASILKYDQPLASRARWDGFHKGYYDAEQGLVQRIKRAIIGPEIKVEKLKTIECSIMDLADDIAYSTYDLDDALEAGFASLPDLLVSVANPILIKTVAIKVWENINGRRGEINAEKIPKELKPEIDQMQGKIIECILNLCKPYLVLTGNAIARDKTIDKLRSAISNTDAFEWHSEAQTVSFNYDALSRVGKDPYLRTQFTSKLVNDAIQHVAVRPGRGSPEGLPALYEAYIDGDVHHRVETLKHLNYELQIMSPRLKVAEYRGKQIVTDLFEALSEKAGRLLLPNGWRDTIRSFREERDRKRAICDFIAGMTDRYALEFYARLNSETAQSIFKPF